MSSIDILVRVVLALTLVLASLALGLLLGQAILWALGTARRLRAREAERRDAMLGVLLAGPTSRQRLGRCLPRGGVLAALLGPLDRLAVRLHLARLRRAGVVRLRRWPGPEGRGEGVGEIRIYALTPLGRELAGVAAGSKGVPLSDEELAELDRRERGPFVPHADVVRRFEERTGIKRRGLK